MTEKFLSEEEKAAVLEAAWKDKKGRLSTPSGYALYVAIDSPRPNLAQLTSSVFEALARDSFNAMAWAKGWGKIVICVQPGGKLGCVLGNESESRYKSFVPVSSKALVDPFTLSMNLPEVGANKIILNSQPVPIEAALISYVHMVDELVLDVYEKRKSLGNWSTGEQRYASALEKVRQGGISLKVASQDEILALKAANPAISVRLYGSGVNKNVPKVMGAAIPSE